MTYFYIFLCVLSLARKASNKKQIQLKTTLSIQKQPKKMEELINIYKFLDFQQYFRNTTTYKIISENSPKGMPNYNLCGLNDSAAKSQFYLIQELHNLQILYNIILYTFNNQQMSSIYRQAVFSRGQRRQTPQSREGITRNINCQPKIVNFNQFNNMQQLQFGYNNVVPKRNIFTAHSKNQQKFQQQALVSNVIHKKQPMKRFNQTAKQGFRKNIERPQSKQEPRNKGWNKSGLLLKTALMQSTRPQTSKGQRPKLSSRQKVQDLSHRRNSEQHDDFKLGFPTGHVQKKLQEGFLISSSSSARKGIHKGRFQFKTSIDPQFLSLFAN